MPKVKNNLVPIWIKKFTELRIDGDKVFCKACGKVILCERKSQITQHINTALHKGKLDKMKKTNQSQPLLRESLLGETARRNEQEEFNFELCSALVKANIPLKKLQNPSFRSFLEKMAKRKVPDESTLRKRYVNDIYLETIKDIKEIIKNKYLYFTVDETTDSCGRYVANLMIGCLSEDHPSKSYLIACKVLDKTNHLTIVRFVNEALMHFFLPDIVPTNKIVLLLSDAAPYMVKAGKQLKVLYENLIHVTCLAHGINRVAEAIRNQFPLVNSLISSTKKVFVKAPLRVQCYREKLPNTPLPPEPVITRWGTWLNAALFYADNLEEIKALVLGFSDNASVCIENSQSVLKKPELRNQLAFIKANYYFVSETITKLQIEGMPLNKSVQLVNEFQQLITAVPGNIGKNILNKFNEVLEKNSGYQFLTKVNKILSLDENSEDLAIDLDLPILSALKNAPVTSVDVERSFSTYKNILSDRRRNFLPDNIEKHLIVNCFASKIV